MADIYPCLSIDQPALYRILVQGSIDAGWEDWFEGMYLTHITLRKPPCSSILEMPELMDATLLTGVLADQAALLGALQRLYSLGFLILKVEAIPSGNFADGANNETRQNTV